MSKLDFEKLTRLTKQVRLFRGVSQLLLSMSARCFFKLSIPRYRQFEETPSRLSGTRRSTLFLRLASMPLSAAKFMTSSPAESISREAEITMKKWAEHYRPVRQRTVRGETTKDKAGALPPAVFEKAKTGKWSELSFPDIAA